MLQIHIKLSLKTPICSFQGIHVIVNYLKPNVLLTSEPPPLKSFGLGDRRASFEEGRRAKCGRCFQTRSTSKEQKNYTCVMELFEVLNFPHQQRLAGFSQVLSRRCVFVPKKTTVGEILGPGALTQPAAFTFTIKYCHTTARIVSSPLVHG